MNLRCYYEIRKCWYIYVPLVLLLNKISVSETAIYEVRICHFVGTGPDGIIFLFYLSFIYSKKFLCMAIELRHCEFYNRYMIKNKTN